MTRPARLSCLMRSKLTCRPVRTSARRVMLWGQTAVVHAASEARSSADRRRSVPASGSANASWVVAVTAGFESGAACAERTS